MRLIIAFAIGFYFAMIFSAQGGSLMTKFPTPPGYAALIAERPDMAFPGAEPWSVDMDLLRRVNREINSSMVYRREPADVWGDGSDCEDFAIKKLEALEAVGVPRGAMRLAACCIDGQGHAVLLVNGEWILTNGRDDVFSRHSSPLRIEAWETVGGWERPGVSLADVIDADGGLGNPDGAESVTLRWGG